MSWKSVLGEGKEIVLATSSKNIQPNAIIVMSLGFIDDKLLIANCQMKSTSENIQTNPNICIVATGKKEYYRVKGFASIFSSGKFFDEAVKKSSPDLSVKSAIVVEVKEVLDLDKGKKIL